MTTNVLRAFRSPDFRDLTRKALDQGWDAYLRPGGHMDVVNPANGAIVRLSTTAHTAGPVLRSKRHDFELAGLRLHPVRRHRRHPAQIPEVATMPDTNQTPPPGGLGQALRPGGRSAGGQYALVRPRVAMTILGRTVKVGERADGKWLADVRDPRMKSGRRQWQDESEAALLSKVERDLVAWGLVDTVPADRQPRRPEPVPVPPAPHAPGTNGAAHPVTWRAVGLDPADYPVATALDALEAAVGPALAALEAAGKGDAAALVRGELAMTAAEAELLALYRAVTRT